jgi:hypothetical protein
MICVPCHAAYRTQQHCLCSQTAAMDCGSALVFLQRSAVEDANTPESQCCPAAWQAWNKPTCLVPRAGTLPLIPGTRDPCAMCPNPLPPSPAACCQAGP